MKLAIMQPYIFPYLGYFQLVNAVDTFVFYDDVSFIKGGWIHRNTILVNNEKLLFSVPLVKQSSFIDINQTIVNRKLYSSWKDKFLKTLEQAYKKAPHFDEVSELVRNVLASNCISISELSVKSVKEVISYLQLPVNFQVSSVDASETKGLNRTERLITICNKNKCDHYINLMGGKDLYKKDDFLKQGIQLSFIENRLSPYDQLDNDFVSGLSIIDVLMFNSIEETKLLLSNYSLH